tara:strand:+ start:4090 stop:4839 length:750 start_codon:yes stop_codon:yes gene_type:complete
MLPDQQLIDVINVSGGIDCIPLSDIVWATPRKFFFQITADQDIKMKGILGGLGGGLSIAGFKISRSIGKYSGQYLGTTAALLITGTGVTFTGVIVDSSQAIVTRNLIEHYTKVNFDDYVSINAGKVFINEQNQLEMLPLEPSISTKSAFLIQLKARKILAAVLSFGLISTLYHLIGEEVPSLVNTNLRGRKLLTFCLLGKLFPKSIIRHRVGLATNFSINFEYAILSTLITIIINRTLTLVHKKYYAKQ